MGRRTGRRSGSACAPGDGEGMGGYCSAVERFDAGDAAAALFVFRCRGGILLDGSNKVFGEV